LPTFFQAAGAPATVGPFNLSDEGLNALGLFRAADFRNQPNKQIFFRVGARNSIDDPGPLPRGAPNADNFIYSATNNAFRVMVFPPPPPGQGPNTPGGGPPPPPTGGS